MEIEEYFSSYKNQLKGKALLAVSGGIDSMCLWFLFRKFEIPHVVAHLNYGLRVAESNADEALVKKVAEEEKVQFFVKQIQKSDFETSKMGIQEAARKFRYDYFEELMQTHDLEFLCTAHHQDDSAETFLINWSRGTGLKGLGGIRSRNNVQRPLLKFSREQIEHYVRKNSIEFREDASNAKNDYLRNWIRNNVLTPWKKKDPSLIQKTAKTIANLQEAQSLLNYFLQKELDQLGFDSSFPFEINIDRFDNAEVAEAIVYQLCAPFGFNRDQIQDIFNAVDQKNNGAMIYSATHRIIYDRSHLILDEQNEELNFTSFLISEEGIDIEDPIAISIDLIDISQADLGKERTEYLNADLLIFPLELRKWKEGDAMQPLGMKGKKKISDMLIDEKVSQLDKESTYVIISENEVACLLGHRISEKFKLNSTTKRVLRIQWQS